MCVDGHSSCTIDTHGRPYTLRKPWLLSGSFVLVVVEVVDEGAHNRRCVGCVRVRMSILVADRNTAVLVNLAVVRLVAVPIPIATKVVELFLRAGQISQVEQFVVGDSRIAGHEAVRHAGAECVTHHAIASHRKLCGIDGANVGA